MIKFTDIGHTIINLKYYFKITFIFTSGDGKQIDNGLKIFTDELQRILLDIIIYRNI